MADNDNPPYVAFWLGVAAVAITAIICYTVLTLHGK
jgi:hypothetical protein